MTIFVQPGSVKSVLLEVLASDHQLGTATGFFVAHESRRYLITNYHVAAGRNPVTGQPEHPSGVTPDALRYRIARSREANSGFHVVVEPTLDNDGTARWYEHPVHGRRVDVVALPLSTSNETPHLPYELVETPSTYLRPGSRVSIVGFPFGLTGGGSLGIWIQGFVASEPDIDLDDLPCFLVDARTRRGQSGSPVLGHGFALLGVYSGRVNAESDLGFVWKSKAVADILRDGRAGQACL